MISFSVRLGCLLLFADTYALGNSAKIIIKPLKSWHWNLDGILFKLNKGKNKAIFLEGKGL